MKLSPQDILRAIRKHPAESVSARELMKSLGLPAGARRILHRYLRELERQGGVRRQRGGRYALAKDGKSLTGVVSVNKAGCGIIRNEKDDAIRIPERYLCGALDGDQVRYVLLRRDRMNRLNGKVVQIVERSGKPVVGVFQPGRGEAYVLPVGSSRQPITVSTGTVAVSPGDWVVVRMVSGKNRDEHPRGEIVENLGNPSDPVVQVKAIACRYAIPLRFPSSVIDAVNAISEEIPLADRQGRKDLCHLPFVTIDGESARDFDDAVTLERQAGRLTLYVAIADVSHYVRTGGLIDRSARERGTSVYFPGFAIPMLPERLSNGLCSLKPGVERLVMVAELGMNEQGAVEAVDFYPAIIRSRARMTYREVQRYLDEGVGEPAEGREHLGQLPLMLDLARLLTKRRRERGALEMEIPEPVVELGPEGSPEAIVYAERLDSHRIIEEFMLAANEAVAGYLTARKMPVVYRIHEPPEPEDLVRLYRYLGYPSGSCADSDTDLASSLQRLVEERSDSSEVRIVSRLLLRSLKQARYSIENQGHFGLAAGEYCHFTSPIRRYPDLLVHRLLKQALAGESVGWQRKELARMADEASKCERNAVAAERDADAMYICQFMESRIGESYDGMISSVQKFGFFVELDRFPVEGLVHVSSLDDDFYIFDGNRDRLVGERSGRLFQVGMKLKILVENVNIARREIDFSLSRSALPGRLSAKERRKVRR